MQTMKAVRIHSYGGPEVLVYEEAPVPELRPGDLLVEVRAAAINPVDWKAREGYLRQRNIDRLPMILGWDFSGTVARTTVERSRFAIGDEVYARPNIGRDGSYAEYIAVSEAEVALKPKSVDHVHAAAIPLACLTAWQALFDAGRLQTGQRVMIHAAAGGVGHFAVQLARWRGAYVIGTASASNHEFIRGLGADEAIDYNSVPFEDAAKDVDVVLDTIGGETQARSWSVIRPGGIVVSILSMPNKEQAEAHHARAGYVFVQPDPEQLLQIAGLVDSGYVRPVVQTVLPLSEAQEAHALSKAGHVRGKIVLTVS